MLQALKEEFQAFTQVPSLIFITSHNQIQLGILPSNLTRFISSEIKGETRGLHMQHPFFKKKFH